jgi:DNA-directed RNA polymerase specialized sigma24 family protein
MTSALSMQNTQHEVPAVFRARFSRCCRLLYFIARRVIGDPEQAGNAVENCWLTASRNPPRFECEGAFRSWLVRVLIDEALAVLRRQRQVAKGEVGLQIDHDTNYTKRSCPADSNHVYQGELE